MGMKSKNKTERKEKEGKKGNEGDWLNDTDTPKEIETRGQINEVNLLEWCLNASNGNGKLFFYFLTNEFIFTLRHCSFFFSVPDFRSFVFSNENLIWDFTRKAVSMENAIGKSK